MQNILASTLDLVISLKREVELKEKAAEEAKEEAAMSGIDILAKVDAFKLAQQREKETKDMVVNYSFHCFSRCKCVFVICLLKDVF